MTPTLRSLEWQEVAQHGADGVNPMHVSGCLNCVPAEFNNCHGHSPSG